MTSYDLLEFYGKIFSEMGNLKMYTDELSNLIANVEVQKNKVLNYTYKYSIGLMPNEIRNNYETARENIISAIEKFAMSFDTLENFQKLIEVRSKIASIFENDNFDLKEEKERILSILDKYNNVTSSIYEYVKEKNNSLIVDLLNKASEAVNEYNEFIEIYNNIKYFIQKTENKIEVLEDEGILNLHFYDEKVNPKYFELSVKAINESYEIMCQILGVSSSEYPLKVIKIESGSLFGKLFGHEKIIDALAFLMQKTTEWIFNKFTLEGKILRCKQLLDLMKEDAEVISIYKELGVDISFDEDITKYHYQLSKSLGNLIGQSTRIKVNDSEFNLEDNLKQKYLEESKRLLLDENKDSNKLENEDK